MSWQHERQLSANKDAAGHQASREFFLRLEKEKLRPTPPLSAMPQEADYLAR